METLKAILEYDCYGVVIGKCLKFAFACGVTGFATFMVDWLIYLLKQRNGPSLLGIRYNSYTQLKVSNFAAAGVAWTLGSFLVGGAGFFAKIFNAEPAAILGIGIFWPIVFTQWINSTEDNEPEEDTDDTEGESI